MADVAALLADLDAESDVLDALVSALPPDAWERATPSPGWAIADQIAHLGWTDDMAILAATDPEAFLAGSVTVDDATVKGSGAPTALLQWWRERRRALHEALLAVPAGTKLPWFGPPMAAASMATARLMETWAHGQDVADALGVVRQPSERLRHVAHIGIRARDFAFRLHDLLPPDDEFRVELTSPTGDVWTWGSDGATQRVSGPALDFCLLVTQRRHRDDLAVHAAGAEAQRWLSIAQAFAGPPGEGRRAEQFTS